MIHDQDHCTTFGQILSDAHDMVVVHANFFPERRHELADGTMGDWFAHRAHPHSTTMCVHRHQVRRNVREWVRNEVLQMNFY